METLTPRQTDTLNCIKNYIVAHGYPPTVREIAEELRVSSPATIQVHLEILAHKGYIRKDGNKNRSIELLVENEFADKDEEIVKVPLLGKVTAGSPLKQLKIHLNSLHYRHQ